MTQRPLFGSAAGTDQRLLLISYHFPPGTAVGALRWQKLAAMAAEHGWALDAITAHPDERPAHDESRLDDLPASTRVFAVRTPVPLAARIRERLRRRAANGAAAQLGRGTPATSPQATRISPAARALDALRWYAHDGRWARRAAALATDLAREVPYVACVTSGPPHMAHEAGRRLAAVRGIPHVMDLRDPWSLVQRLAPSMDSPVWYALARRYERRCVAGACLVVMNTRPATDAMRARYPATAARIIAVPNGYDDEPVPPVTRDEAFVIAHAGTIYLDRDPRPLLRAAAHIIHDRRLSPEQFRLEFMGTVEGMDLEGLAAQEGLARHVRRYPPGPRRAAFEFMARASMVVTLHQDSYWAIQSKVYEYMLFDAWLLVLAPPGSATAQLLAGSPADVVPPGDDAQLIAAIERRYAEHVSGVRPLRLAHDHRFSRRHQAAVLFDAIARLCHAT